MAALDGDVMEVVVGTAVATILRDGRGGHAVVFHSRRRPDFADTETREGRGITQTILHQRDCQSELKMIR